MYPKIGIRPTIDGRRGGIREGIEAQTMKMAEMAQALISTLKYPDGSPVQAVLSPITISGGAEAAMCDDYFSGQNIVATLTVTPCWCYGTETYDMNPNTIKAVWGLNGTEKPGAVYLSAVMSAYAQKGLPAFAIYGKDVQDASDESIPPDVEEKIKSFAKCAICIGWIKSKAYVNLGGVAMGIMGSFCDANLLQHYLGLRSEWVDMTEILRRITLQIYDEKEYEKAYSWVKANCKEGKNCNEGIEPSELSLRSRVVPEDETWSFVTKMTLVIRDILFGNKKLAELGWQEESLGKNAVAGGFQGQRHWTDWLPSGDFAETILASSFDWNGPKMPTAFATENDTLNGISMLLGSIISQTAPCFHDLRTYWSPEAVNRVTGWEPIGYAENGFLHLLNSGATALDGTATSKDSEGNPCHKPFWEMTESDIRSCLDATDWCRTNNKSFRGGGFSCHYNAKAEIPVTMIRCNIVEGIGLTMQIAEGSTVVLPDSVHDALVKRTNPYWPTIWFAPRLTGKGAFTSVYSVMSNWGSNHCVTVYGHIGADLLTLCSMLRIHVSMHNIETSSIFRPHCWSAFGTDNLEAADYAACQYYGPLY